MLPGNFLGFDINGNGGILLVPFNKSGNQFGGPYKFLNHKALQRVI